MKKPLVTELVKFLRLFSQSAPPGHMPWLFPAAPGGKEPVLYFGSWKDSRNRLTPQEALRWLAMGGNVALAAMAGDELVLIDIDNPAIADQLTPTLIVRTRSRQGSHGIYFSQEDIPNIPTPDSGEVRARNQYVIAAGSYVDTDPDSVPEDQRDLAGYYTVEVPRPPAWITYRDIPDIFRETYEKVQAQPNRKSIDFNPKQAAGRHSALYDITARDVVQREGGSTKPTKRWANNVFHPGESPSKTGANMSLSKKGLLMCWRHNVSLNGLQALAVLSGHMSCMEAGAAHKNSGAGPSQVVGEDGAIFHAWLYAKQNGYIPIDDPIPVRAMHYVARKHRLYEPKCGDLLPRNVYLKVLEIVGEEY